VNNGYKIRNTHGSYTSNLSLKGFMDEGFFLRVAVGRSLNILRKGIKVLSKLFEFAICHFAPAYINDLLSVLHAVQGNTPSVGYVGMSQ